jgi:hypothetical protein
MGANGLQTGHLLPMTPLAVELEAFRSNESNWRSIHGARVFLVKGTQLVSVFDNAMQAIAEGSRRFGNEPFLVRRPLSCQCRDFKRLRSPEFPVWLSAASVVKGSTAEPISGMANIDTGSSVRTFVAESVAQKLKLPVVNFVEVSSPVFGGQKSMRPVYAARISTPHGACIDIQAGGLDLNPTHCLVLIGMDVLKNCVLTARGLESFEIGPQTHA